jgi:hypothetical protein
MALSNCVANSNASYFSPFRDDVPSILFRSSILLEAPEIAVPFRFVGCDACWSPTQWAALILMVISKVLSSCVGTVL